jgi:hypothetical protein
MVETILSYRFGRGSRRRSYGSLINFNQILMGVLGSYLALPTEYLFAQHYLAYYSPTLLPNNLSQSSDVVKRYGTNYLVFLFFHEFGTCGWSSTCFIPSLRRLSLLTFRPHLQPKVFHINLRHTSPSTLTITWFGIDASGPSDAASCPNLRARRSPHSISHYRLQIVQYCFPDMPTSAPYQLSRKLDMALLLQPCYVDW